jgi:hypothetical protein
LDNVVNKSDGDVDDDDDGIGRAGGSGRGGGGGGGGGRYGYENGDDHGRVDGRKREGCQVRLTGRFEGVNDV